MEEESYNLFHSIDLPNDGVETLLCSIVKYPNNEMVTLFLSAPLHLGVFKTEPIQ